MTIKTHNPEALIKLGLLPIKNKEIRFAIGDPNGLTTFSWRIWRQKEIDGKFSIYVMCRNLFTETKVSLHPSGRWRMGFTEEAIEKNDQLIQPGADKAWDVWEKPPEQLPMTTIAFRLFFSQRDATVTPQKRIGKSWSKGKEIIYIETPPKGKLTAVTIFITQGSPNLTHETERSFCLGSLELDNNLYAKIIAHAEPEGSILNEVDNAKIKSLRLCELESITVPKDSMFLFLGTCQDKSKFLTMTPYINENIDFGAG